MDSAECPAKAIQLLPYRDVQMEAKIEALLEPEMVRVDGAALIILAQGIDVEEQRITLRFQERDMERWSLLSGCPVVAEREIEIGPLERLVLQTAE